MSQPYDPNLTRIADLQERIDALLSMTRDLQRYLDVAPDPLEYGRLALRLEHVQKQRKAAMAEYESLTYMTGNPNSAGMRQVSTQLEEIDAKLIVLHADFSSTRRLIMGRFDTSEQHIIGIIVGRLDAKELAETEAALLTLDASHVADDQLDASLGELRELLVAFSQVASSNLPNVIQSIEQVMRVIEDPKLGVKHKLKIAVPLIPFIMSYEGELALDVVANVRKAYARFLRVIEAV